MGSVVLPTKRFESSSVTYCRASTCGSPLLCDIPWQPFPSHHLHLACRAEPYPWPGFLVLCHSASVCLSGFISHSFPTPRSLATPRTWACVPVPLNLNGMNYSALFSKIKFTSIDVNFYLKSIDGAGAMTW